MTSWIFKPMHIPVKLQVDKGGTVNMNPVGLVGAVAYDIVAHATFRAFNLVVHFTGGRLDYPGHFGPDRPFRQIANGLFDDPQGLLISAIRMTNRS